MATQKTGLLLCGECKESKFLSQGNQNSRFLTLHVSMPEGTDADMIDLLAKSLCFEHYKRKEDILMRVDTASLHASNSLLSEEEERFCTFHRKEAKRELSALEDVISATGQVELRREDLKSIISQFDKFLSPARRVPKEVLTEVARYMIAEDLERGSLDVRGAIWTLSHVSSSWRTFVLNTPIFWSNLKIHGKQPRFAPSILLQCINRSQSAPLDVSFESMKTETSRVLFQQICSVSHRWRSLGLRIHGCHWPCLRQVRNTLAELESLSINIIGSIALCIPQTSDIFAFTPKLQNVRLGMTYSTPHYLQFSNDNIIEFKLWLNEEWLTHILSVIPRSAVRLTLAASPNFDPTRPTITPSIYPSAADLRVGTKSWLLDLFTCPKLDTLQLSCLDITGEFMDNHFFPFLARSAPTLSKLRLHSLDIPSEDLLRQVYETMHTINELIISTEDYDDNWIHVPSLFEPLLLTSDRSEDFLPRLTTLTIEFDFFYPFEPLYRLIHSVVKSRVEPPNDYHGEKLRCFTFYDGKTSGTDKITLATYNDLDRLARECTPLSD